MTDDDTLPWPHYPDDRQPSQHPDGPRAPEPVSHVEPEIPSTLYGLLAQIEHVREIARDYHHDPVYHRLIAALRQHRVVLLAMLEARPDSVILPRLIAEVEEFTGQ